MSIDPQFVANRRRWLRRLSLPLTILALSLVAIYPLFGSDLPCTDDAAFHLLRLTQLDHLLRQGVFYSRWAPDMAQGYGFPFFNFYAPLAYYLAELASLLVQNLNLGLRLTLALGMFFSGLSAYRLSRDHFSSLAALVTAVAYMYAPYYAFDVYFRGNLAESMAWPLLPLALWFMGRLARTHQLRWLVLTSLNYAAVLLTHNVFALIFSPLLALYGLWETWPFSAPKSSNPRRKFGIILHYTFKKVWPVLLSLILGLGLSAFFWLPALVERSLVHSDRLLVPPLFVYWGNFLSPSEIFAPPHTVHPDLINPSPTRALGLVPLLLALPSLLVGWRLFQENQRRQILFFALATAVYTFLMTAASTPIWANLPLIEYVQFPWRLLGPAALMLALLVGASVDVAMRRSSSGRLHLVMAVGFITALILADLTWLDMRYCPGLAAPTVADIQAFERDSFTIGTTAKGEYLPLTVTYLPEEPATTPFLPLPETAVLRFVTTSPLHYQATIHATEPFTLTANVFDYAGWQATVDEQFVPITPDVGTGLITVPIPVGDHTLDIRFGSTPLRSSADLISLISLILLVLLVGSKHRLHSLWLPPEADRRIVDSAPDDHRLPLRQPLFALCCLALALAALVILILPRIETPLRRSGLAALGETAVFTNNMVLRDYQIASRTLAADAALQITAVWQAQQPLARSFRDTVRLIDPDGNWWSVKTAAVPRAFRGPRQTQTWSPDEYAESQHLLEPLPGTPPGIYHIELILFDAETLATVPLTDGRLSLDMGTVQITRPDNPMQPSAQYDTHVDWGDLSLVGYSLDRTEAAPGDPFLLTLVWQVHTTPNVSATMRLTLVAPDDTAALQLDLPPVRNDFPTTRWLAGDRWLAQHGFRLPLNLDSGVYQWRLSLCDVVCRDLTADLGTITINAPERLFTPPPLALIPENGSFTDLTTLLGANLALVDGRLSLTLAWQADAETAISYRVFVHLVDESGQILAQSDGEPAAWTRPTTGWLPGEIVLDIHGLDLINVPAGTYALNIGLYDPQSGNRVPLADGTTAVTITAVSIPDISVP